MTLSGILQSVVFLTLFYTFINAGIGSLLVYTMLAAQVLSFLIWLVSRKRFTVSVDEFAGVTEVGGECIVHIRLKKNGFCFLPLIVFRGEMDGVPFEAHTSLLFSSESEIAVKLRPKSCGLNKVRISSCTAQDMLRMFCARSAPELCSSVAVLPRYVDYIGPEVVPSFLPSECEEREEGVTVSFGGTAGYEHRDYVAGDSPRRINYKLSAKRHRLMVRMDESGGTESTNIILSDDADGSCAEQALALADKLVLSGSPAAVYHHGEVFEAALPASIDKLREWLAFRDFSGVYIGADTAPTGNVCVVISPRGIVLK